MVKEMFCIRTIEDRYASMRTLLTRTRALACVAMLALGCGATPAMASPMVLSVGMEEADNWPFEGEDKSGALSGFHVELVRAVARQLGWQVEFQRFPWKRTLRMLETGELQAATFVAKSREREEFAVFNANNVLHISRVTLYVKRERINEIHFQLPLEAMMRRWYFGASQGYYYNDEIVNLMNAGVPVDQTAVTPIQLFHMLDRGRFDVAFGARNALERAEEQWPDIRQQIQKLDGAVLDGQAMYLAFSRKNGASYADAFAKAYRSYRHKPAYKRLAARFGIGDSLPKAQEFR